MGIGQKVKDAAHKMGIGQTEGEQARGTSAYTNVGATYGSEGSSGIAAPVAPGTAPAPMAEGATDYTRTEGQYGGITETRTATAEVPVAMQQTITTTAPAAEVRQGEGASCGAQYFTRTEDRPVVKERVELVEEHRPVEKEFVVETRATGVERKVAEGRSVEHLGTTERVVAAQGPKAPCE